jgi:hypothetical protein
MGGPSLSNSVLFVFVDAYICTAHHKEDQVETVLLQLIRGSHISNLHGVRNSIIIVDIFDMLYYYFVIFTFSYIDEVCERRVLEAPSSCVEVGSGGLPDSLGPAVDGGSLQC